MKSAPFFRPLILFLLTAASWSAPPLCAQTTLTGDHIIEGDLTVGAFGDLHHLTVRGRTVLGYGGATGNYAVSLAGGGAYGNFSVAIAGGDAYGFSAIGMSEGSAYGEDSTALSSGEAIGPVSTAMSNGIAEGNTSTAINWGFSAGLFSTAINSALALGDYSFAIGQGTCAGSAHSVALGRYNKETGSNAQSWTGNDVLFVLGNGTGNSADPPEIQKSDAFVVYQNGDVVIPKPQGDVLMGEFAVGAE